MISFTLITKSNKVEIYCPVQWIMSLSAAPTKAGVWAWLLTDCLKKYFADYLLMNLFFGDNSIRNTSPDFSTEKSVSWFYMRISNTKGETPSINKFTLKENQETLGNSHFELPFGGENCIFSKHFIWWCWSEKTTLLSGE